MDGEIKALEDRLLVELKTLCERKGLVVEAGWVDGEIRISNGIQIYDQPERASKFSRAVRMSRVEGPRKGCFQLLAFIEPRTTLRQMDWASDRERVYGTECFRTVELPGTPYRVLVCFRTTEPLDRSLLGEILKVASMIQWGHEDDNR